MKDTVKAISVGGVVPTEETVKDGSYAVQRPFVLVTKTDTKLSEVAQKFFDLPSPPKPTTSLPEQALSRPTKRKEKWWTCWQVCHFSYEGATK